MITQSRLKKVVDYNESTGVFTWTETRGGFVKKGVACGCVINGYISIGIDGKRYKAHRLAWLYMNGAWPKEYIDHIDTNKLNNRISNLREASHAENIQNQRVATPTSSSGMLGASRYKRTGKWQSVIGVNGKKKHLGYFSSALDAHEAYVKAKRLMHPFCTL